MRTLTTAVAAIALTLGVIAPALAHPQQEVLPPIGVDLTHEATDNVGFVARFHEHFGSAGGILTSNDWNDGQEFFVVTDPRGLWTYDLSNPESPELLGVSLTSQTENTTNLALGQEDPSTDGRVVLMDAVNPDTGVRGLQIISIEDPTAPTVVGSVDGVTDHTSTCVTDIETGNGCGYAYGRSDNIIDIRDPANPVEVETGWKTAVGEGGYAHDLTEIRPGLVMHAGAEPVLMDTTDPANPVKLVHITLFDHGPDFVPRREWSVYGYHSVEWPRGGEDAFLLMGTEISPNSAGDDCSADEAVLETWDARPVIAALDEMEALEADGMSHAAAREAVFGEGDVVEFERIDAYQASGTGAYVTGQAPTNILYCAHWMEAERDWADGGRMVAGYYNRGARFIDVAPVGATDENGNDIAGEMQEIGWFTGADAYAGSAQWITDEVVFVMDYVRGLDIIKITDEDATSTYTGTGSVHERSLTIAEMESMGIAPPAPERAPYGALTIAGSVLLAGALLRRRHRATTPA